jgi:glucose-1-phosphate adenylyltransferase
MIREDETGMDDRDPVRDSSGAYGPYKQHGVDVPTMAHLARQTMAIVLAGGRGTRLGALTERRAKPAVPFGGKFRIIDFALSNCLNSGIRRIGVATQYQGRSLNHHLHRGWSFLDGRFNEFIEALPAQQREGGDWYKGTADAVFQNMDFLRRQDAQIILVLAGDHIYKMDYARMLDEHVSRRADMTLGCVEVPLAEATQLGVLAVDDRFNVVGFQEKPQQPSPIPGRPDRALGSMGIYVFNAAFLYEQLARDASDALSAHDFGFDLIPYLVRKGARIFAHRLKDSCTQLNDGEPYWRDVGTIDAYWEANLELTRVSPALNLYDQSWPIWTYQEQVPPAKFIFDRDDRRGGAHDSMVSGGCIISGSIVRGSLLFSSVHVHSYCSVEDCVILPHAEIGARAELRRVVVDSGVQIPRGLRAGFDPEEDARRFHVTPGGITLITASMLAERPQLAG